MFTALDDAFRLLFGGRKLGIFLVEKHVHCAGVGF